ncbi:MAG TPA: RagB/SusD family nutrient uptake outer membrane protein [Chitinophagaceae bacterium]|nr:RagB/SusD family nutrient uptake outer membrane protein [Chitinophagaceae bacterium]
MKTIKFAVIVVTIMGLIAGLGCKKFLEEKPISSLSPENFWKSETDATSWMAGIYNSLQTTLSTNFYDWGEVRSDNVRVGGTGNAQLTMITNTLSANDADINGITRWTNLYTTISLCNYGIKYLPEMISKNIEGKASTYQEYLGQCYGLRALLYFYGLRVWGRMPIHTDPIQSLSQPIELPRSSIADLKQLIQSDITKSLETVGTVTSDKTKKYYIKKAAVYAMKTDVHMWFQEYDEALAASDLFMTTAASGGAAWINGITAWKSIFTDPVNSPETVFNLFWSAAERGGAVGVCQKVGSSSNTNQYEVTTALWLEFRNRVDPVTNARLDGRYWALWDTIAYFDEATYDAAVVQLGKYSPWKTVPGAGFTLQGNSDCDAKIPIYRYADIMLLRAEALTHKGRYQEALDIVNKVRSRVGYTVQARLTDYTGDIMTGIERTILKERQLELVGEGKRWFDLCRIGKIYDFTNNGYGYLREILNPILATRTGSILYDGINMGRILYPINSDMFDANSKLVGDQNPPYDE